MTQKQSPLTWSKYPFVNRGRVIMFITYYAVMMGIPAYIYAQSSADPANQTLMAQIMLTLSVLSAAYLVFFYLPYVFFIRKTGRFIYIQTTRWSPFSPFGDEPLKYGAVPFRPLSSFLLMIACMGGFFVIVAFPIIYLLFAQK